MANDWGDEAANDWGDLPDGAPAPAAAPKKYAFLRPKGVLAASSQGGGPVEDGSTGAVLRADPNMGPLETGLRVAGSGASFGMDAVPRGLLHAARSGKSYQEARRETDLADQQAFSQAGNFALPLALGGGAASVLAAPALLGRALAPVSTAMGAPGRGILTLAGRTLLGVGEAAGVSAGLGAARAAGTDKGAGEGAKEGAKSPWNLLGALGGAASWLGARARPAAQEAAIGYLHPSQKIIQDIEAAHGGPGVPVEDAMRSAGQRSIDLGALKTGGAEMGTRAVGLEAGNKAATAALENTVQELNVRGATLDRSVLLTDIKNAILSRFDKPGAAEFTKEMRGVAEEVLQAIANDRDLRSGAPLGNFVTAKRFLQKVFEKHQSPIPGSEFNKMLQRAEQDAARILREHTEAAALKADPNVHGPEFVRLNRQLHKDIPLEEAAKAEAVARQVGRAGDQVHQGGSAKSLGMRMLSSEALRDTAPMRVRANGWIDAAQQATPDGAHQFLIQLLRNNRDRKKEAQVPYRLPPEE